MHVTRTVRRRFHQAKAWPPQAKRGLQVARQRALDNPVARHPVAVVGRRVFQEFNQDDAPHFAAGVAYYALFSLFPLLLGLIALTSIFLDDPDTEEQLLSFVTDYIPGSGDLVSDIVQSVAASRGPMGVIALAGLLWSASGVFGAISRAVNRAWNIKKDRPFYISKPRHIAMALATGLLFLLSVALTSAIRVLSQVEVPVLGIEFAWPPVLVSLALTVVPWLISVLVFTLVYKFVPNTDARWSSVWLGAIVAAVLFEAGKNLFVWYLQTFANFNQVYGPLTSVILLLLWAYLSSLILLLGAEVSHEFQRYRQEQETPEAAEASTATSTS